MDFSLNEDERMILETTRTFVRRELDPLLSKVQAANVRNEHFPDPDTLRSLQLKAKEVGLWGLTTPTEYGGAGLSALLSTLITMETARSLIPFDYGGMMPGALAACTPAQRKKYLEPTVSGEDPVCFALSEPDAGSDATRIRTSAVKKGSKWVLNGTKTWISNAHERNHVIVFAVTDKEKRHRGGITAFFVDRDMGYTTQPIHFMSDHAAGEISFKDVEVPEENVLGEVGQGFALAMNTLGATRFGIAARAVGKAQRLTEMAAEYAKQRVAFGNPIADYQAIQWMIADSVVEIEAAKWLTLNTAFVWDKGGHARHEIAMSKLYASQMVWRVCDRVLQIHGAMGYTKDLPIERIMREVRVYRIYEGADEIHKKNIARSLLKGEVQLSSWN